MADYNGPAKRTLRFPDGVADEDSLSAPLINKDSPAYNNNLSTPVGRRGAPAAGTPAERVLSLLTPVKGGDEPSSSEEDEEKDELADVLGEHYLFCQLNKLCHFPDGEQGWKEISRWLKYEEKVEVGERWSKPHVATSSLHALLDFRKALESGAAVVDLDANATHGCLHQMADLLVERIREQSDLTDDQLVKLTEVLVSPYKHSNRQVDGDKKKDRKSAQKAAAKVESEIDTPDKKKKKGISRKGNVDKIPGEYHVYAGGVEPSDLKPYKPNKRVQKKVPRGAEVVNLLVGQVDFLDKPLMAIARLARGTVLSGISEVTLPSRFVFLALGPKGDQNIREYEELGRSVGTLFSDKVFAEVAYRAVGRQDILDGLDEYIDDLTVLPPSIWDPSTRLMPPVSAINKEGLRKRLNTKKRYGHEMELHGTESGDPTLVRTGKICGGVIADAKRRYALYKSDIVDGVHIQCLASIVFLFFACITPIVTFGGLMGTATDGQMGTMECILSGAICGLLFALFAGQPLTIVGATGPLLIFESILYQFCKDQEVDFLSFRFWVGIWSAAILLVIVLFDLSYLVGYITRFTEESFSVLISLIFIMEAFKKALGIWSSHPVHTDTLWEEETHKCYCVHPGNDTTSPPVVQPPEGIILGNDTSNVTVIPKVPFDPYNWTSLVYGDCITHEGKVEVHTNCLSPDECVNQEWSLVGSACDDHSVVDSVGDVFLLSLFLFFGTFVIAIFFRNWRTAPYFPSMIRNRVADFAVLMSILIMTGIDIAFGVDTPKLNVPAKFATTVPGRGWVVNPGGLGENWYYALLAVLPALLGTILIFLDQQITAVIINRKDHKLKKGPGFHLDLFVLAITLIICSALGLPWFVAATVRSITHVKSLTKLSETSAPGETPAFEGIREQRVTAFCIHVLIAVSVLCTPILKFVPMPVLYGVFLYMGITSLTGVQFVERIKILMMPAKYQPDYMYLRHVPTKRVHIFTGLQILCMIGMWIVKSIKKIAILFPLLVLALCFVRKAMDFWYFTQQDLYFLDHILPEAERRKEEDEELMAEALDGEKLTFDTKAKGWPEEEKTGGSSASFKKEKAMA